MTRPLGTTNIQLAILRDILIFDTFGRNDVRPPSLVYRQPPNTDRQRRPAPAPARRDTDCVNKQNAVELPVEAAAAVAELGPRRDGKGVRRPDGHARTGFNNTRRHGRRRGCVLPATLSNSWLISPVYTLNPLQRIGLHRPTALYYNCFPGRQRKVEAIGCKMYADETHWFSISNWYQMWSKKYFTRNSVSGCKPNLSRSHFSVVSWTITTLL